MSLGSNFVSPTGIFVSKFSILCQPLLGNTMKSKIFVTFLVFFVSQHSIFVSVIKKVCHRTSLLCQHMRILCHRTIFLDIMTFDNKTILIAGLVAGGIVALYLHQTEIASAIFGGLVGYLSKDVITVQHEEVSSEDGFDTEEA